MIKQIALEKLQAKGTLIIVPKAVETTQIPMSDLLNEDTGEHHSIATIAQETNWKPRDIVINGNDYILCFYCVDRARKASNGGVSEEDLLRAFLESNGLVDGFTESVEDIDYTSWTGNEYGILSEREVSYLLGNVIGDKETENPNWVQGDINE